jgi:hypothetical protein
MQRWTLLLAGVVTLVSVCHARAQNEGATAGLALALARKMGEQRLEFFAAADPQRAGRYIGVMRFGTSQLSLVSDQVDVPMSMDAHLARQQYEDVYRALTTPLRWDQHFFVHDLNGLGLRSVRDMGEAFDMVSQSGLHTSFDGDWASQHLSSTEYHRAFIDAERLYADALRVLIARLAARRMPDAGR